MARFQLEKQITSCCVNKELLKQLEHFLAIEIPKMIDIPKYKIQESFSLSIIDNLGTENLQSISNYSSSLFSNSTYDISLGFTLYKPKIAKVSVRFNKKRMLSYISIDCEFDNAKERVLVMYEEIKKIIDKYGNRNKIFHPPVLVDGVLFFLGSISFFTIFISFYQNAYLLGLMSSFTFLFVAFYYFTGKKLKPYISFESAYYLSIERLSNWFIYIFLGFFLLGALFVILKR